MELTERYARGYMDYLYGIEMRSCTPEYLLGFFYARYEFMTDRPWTYEFMLWW